MSTTWTIPGIGHSSLGSGVRQYAACTELDPTYQCPLSDGEFETAQTWASGTTFGSWTLLNTANILALDEHTTRKSQLYISNVAGTGTNWYQSQVNAPTAYQSVTGDFDLQTVCAVGEMTDYASAGLVTINPSSNAENVSVQISHNSGGITGSLGCASISNHGGAGTSGSFSAGPSQWFGCGLIWLRLQRSGSSGSGGGTFNCYYSFDGKTWTSLQSVVRGTGAGDMPATLWVGATVLNGVAVAGVSALFQHIRNTLPYNQSSPTSSYVLDSGASGTTWDTSAFAPNENPFGDFDPYSSIGFGTLKYQIGAGNSNPPTLNGTWLTASGIQALGTITGQYLKLSVQYNSAHGYDLVRFGGATIAATISAGGGGTTVIVVDDD